MEIIVKDLGFRCPNLRLKHFGIIFEWVIGNKWFKGLGGNQRVYG